MWYVLGEIAFLVVLALLLGLFLGWLIWGQRRPSDPPKAPKVKRVNDPNKSVVDLNKIEQPNVPPVPQPQKTEAGARGRIVDLGQSGGLLD